MLELGCGRGEYTVELARNYPNVNFIGIDVKGARLWRGAKTAFEEPLSNAAFLRVQIETLTDYFDEKEVSEIWITFPDPQPQLSRTKKRLTSPRFLDYYKHILNGQGMVHLKTDNTSLYEYTLEVINENKLNVIRATDDLYASELADDILSIKTTYEKKYLAEGIKIKYLQFSVHNL